MVEQFESKIENLAKIKVRKEFKNLLRQDLMQRVLVNKPERTGLFVAFDIFSYVKVLKHAYVPVVLGIFIFFGSGALAMMAAGDSLPGEFLYGVKRAREKAQITLTLGQTSKIKREVSFAENRMQELSRLSEEIDEEIEKLSPFGGSPIGREIKKLRDEDDEIGQDGEKVVITVGPEVIVRAVEDFHKELSKVNNRLDSLGEEPNSEAVEAARAVEEKTEEFANALTQVAEQEELPAEVKERIISAFNILDEVNTRALGVVIKEPVDMEGEKMEALVKRLENKILATEERVAGVREIVREEGVVGDTQGVLLSLEKKIELAKIILVEARESLTARDLEMTLQKVEESRELVVEVSEEIRNKESEPSTRLRPGKLRDDDDEELEDDEDIIIDSDEGVEVDDDEVSDSDDEKADEVEVEDIEYSDVENELIDGDEDENIEKEEDDEEGDVSAGLIVE